MQTSSPTMRLMDCCNHYRVTHYFMLNDISLIWWYIYRAYTKAPISSGGAGSFSCPYLVGIEGER